MFFDGLERINIGALDHTIVPAYKEITRNTERFKFFTDNRHTIIRTFSIIGIYKNKKGESFLIRLFKFTVTNATLQILFIKKPPNKDGFCRCRR